MTYGTKTPDCPTPILIIAIWLRKVRSHLLANAFAYGSRAIVLLRPFIPLKYSAANNAGWMPPSSIDSSAAKNPRGMPIENTVEQITAAKSVPNNFADDASESKTNNFGFPNALPF